MSRARVIPLHGSTAGSDHDHEDPATPPDREQSGEASDELGRTAAARTESVSGAESASERNARAAPSSDPRPDSEESQPPGWERHLTDAVAFLRRRVLGDYRVDDFGFDPDFTDHVVLPALKPLYDTWFRVESFGTDNVPSEGGALIVANHSGTVPLDALMTACALRTDHPTGRYMRGLAADLVFRLPGIGTLSRKAGQTLACTADTDRLLGSGELVAVWPEGYKGVGKPFADRYKLQRFGRGGFVSAALRSGVPIIPCSIVGAEETYPKIGDVRPLARLFGLPYFPVTPFFPLLGPLGTMPLPSKWYIEFGPPVPTHEYAPEAADDPMRVFNLTDDVRERIQQTLYRLLAQRSNVFLG